MKIPVLVFLSLFLYKSTVGIDYPWTASVKWALTGKYSSDEINTYDVFYDGNYNEEVLWVKSKTTIDIYDLESDKTPDIARSLSTGTDCQQSLTMMSGNTFLSFHGEYPQCMCAWSVDNPCPHKLEIRDPNGRINYEDKYEYIPNTMFLSDMMEQNVVAGYGIAKNTENGVVNYMACNPIENPEDIINKYCLVYRGACTFQAKWEHCHQAGAVGVIMVNNIDSYFMGMWVSYVTTPYVGVPLSVGQKLIDDVDKGIKLALGPTIGADSPDPNYTGPDPLVYVNYYTGDRYDISVPFATVDTFFWNPKNDYLYFVGVDGLGLRTLVVDSSFNPYKEIGTFELPSSGSIRLVNRKGEDDILMFSDFWSGGNGQVKFYSLASPLAPQFLSGINYEPCDEVSRADVLHDVVMHPSKKYVYLLPSIHTVECDPFTVLVYDIQDILNPTHIGSFNIPEVEVGAFVSHWVWADDNIASITMTSAGVVWYDMTEFMNPSPLARIDLNAVSNTYTTGSWSSTPTADKLKWIVHDFTDEYENFYFVHLKASSEECSGVQAELQSIEAQLNAIQIDTSQCYQYGYDYGAKTSEACGYAPLVGVIVHEQNFPYPEHIPVSIRTLDPTLQSMEDCQKYCQDEPKCDFFAYEWEYGYHECYLKEGYEGATSGCRPYTIWLFDDPNWHGVSGPKDCGDREQTGGAYNSNIMAGIEDLEKQLNAIQIDSTDCFKLGYEYGVAYGNCPAVVTVKAVVNSVDFVFSDAAMESMKEVDIGLRTIYDCQDHCASMEACEYFSYEWDNGNHKCYLKGAQTATDATNGCRAYSIWVFEDPSWHGASGPKSCKSDNPYLPANHENIMEEIQQIEAQLNAVTYDADYCFQQGMDYGQQTDSFCGYAPIVMIIANDPGYQFPPFHGDPEKQSIDPGLNSPEDCQRQCGLTDGCDFFSYEWEGGFHECFLKTGYDDPQCRGYSIWIHSEPGWHGISGPRRCEETASGLGFSVSAAADDDDTSSAEIAYEVLFILFMLAFIASCATAVYFYMQHKNMSDKHDQNVLRRGPEMTASKINPSFQSQPDHINTIA